MERLIAEIEAYAAATDSTPPRFLRTVIGAGWGQWSKWKEGSSSPTVITADKIRAYMAANPPPQTSQPQPNE